MKGKIWLVAIPLALVAVALLVNLKAQQVMTGENLKYTGVACVYKNDQLIGCYHNLITNNGKNLIKQDMMGTATVTLNQIAIANNTVAQSASDTTLQGEWTTCGLAKATGTLTDIGVGNWSINYQWTSTCNNAIVNATGIYDSVSNTLFAETTFPTTTLQANDKINITYYTWVS
jgi:hypothetical protein